MPTTDGRETRGTMDVVCSCFGTQTMYPWPLLSGSVSESNALKPSVMAQRRFSVLTSGERY